MPYNGPAPDGPKPLASPAPPPPKYPTGQSYVSETIKRFTVAIYKVEHGARMDKPTRDEIARLLRLSREFITMECNNQKQLLTKLRETFED